MMPRPFRRSSSTWGNVEAGSTRRSSISATSGSGWSDVLWSQSVGGLAVEVRAAGEIGQAVRAKFFRRDLVAGNRCPLGTSSVRGTGMGGMGSGRRRLHSVVRSWRGVPASNRPRGQRPEPPAGQVQKPATISGPAGKVWDRLAPICLEMGTLTAADVTVFGTLCELQARLEAAATAKTDIVRTANTLRRFYQLFGLEPVSRGRIMVAAPPDSPSKWDGILPR